MVSQALGARKTERVPRVVLHALWIVAVPATVFALVTAVRPDWLFGMFSQDPAVLDMALTYIPVAMVQYPPLKVFHLLYHGSSSSAMREDLPSTAYFQRPEIR